MKIYLDMCSIQRPLDSKAQVRVAVEAEAILNVIQLWEAGQIELISSFALVFEAEQIPGNERRTYTLEVLSRADSFVSRDEQIDAQAQGFVSFGIKPLDALHLASAIALQADYFCTCDDRFLRRAKQIDTAQTKVVSPLELIAEIS
ncbi:PIN domain-containing protein [Leptolyngbya sp. NIES-2104]|uniref:PIN domain-containing protein n=1 Tax=Leptolyngbya sp. NIES-2104 TaxID=1552121 RepID=UPI000AE8FE9D|nr:PIN domain-containing protein [Leptolyngbya sp. NIES-2104]